MVFLLLCIVCNILVLQSYNLIHIALTHKMPWYAGAAYMVIGLGVGIFSYITAVFSLATFLDGVN